MINLIDHSNAIAIGQNGKDGIKAESYNAALGAHREEVFNNIMLMMSSVFNTTHSFISLHHKSTVFSRSSGDILDDKDLGIINSLCTWSRQFNDPIVFEDLLAEPSLADHLNMKTKGGLRFYASAPLISTDGSNIGNVCIADTKPAKFSEENKQLLHRFAVMAMHEIEVKNLVNKIVNQQKEKAKDILTVAERFKIEKQAYNIFKTAPLAISIYKGPDYIIELSNDIALQIAGKTSDVIGKPILEVLPEIAAQGFITLLDHVVKSGESYYASEAPLILGTGEDLRNLYLNFVYQPYYEMDGRIVGVIAFAVDVTEQVLSRKRVEESETRFRNIIEQAQDPILILKGEDLVLDVANDSLFKLWNVGEEAVGKPFLKILPEMKDQGFYSLLQEVYSKGVTHHGHEVPVYFLRSNGKEELVYFDFVYQPYREVDNSISGVLVLATNVTEQVIAKQKLLEGEKNFEALVMQAPVGICILKGDEFRVEVANETYLQLVGKTAEQVLDKLLWEGLPEARGQGFDALLKDVMRTGVPYQAKDCPVELNKAGGLEKVYVDFVYQPLKETGGTTNRIMVLVIDVTDKVIARQKIEYAEERARLAIEAAEQGTYEVNLVTNEMMSTPRLNNIFGFDRPVTREELISSFFPEDLKIRDEAYNTAFQTGKLEYETRVVWADGSIHWIKVKGSVLFDDQRKPIRLLGVVQDITGQKEFAEDLKKRVEERTIELSRANEQLKRMNIELEQFAYAASHDMQEPLRKVQTFSNMLLEHTSGIVDEKSRIYLRKIESSVSRMKRIIEDLLKYSSEGSGDHRPVPTDLNIILDEIEVDLDLRIQEKDATVIREKIPELNVVPGQANQLFYNILSNALKFAKTSEPLVIEIKASELTQEQIESRKQLKPGQRYICISCKDNGIGFDQVYAEQIFSLFKRLNGKNEYEGTGIGLALCKKIMINHGGDIYAESQPGKGSTFHIIFPMK